MTDERLSGLENRIDRVEAALVSAGEFLTQASSLIQQDTARLESNTSRLDRMEELLIQTFEITQRTAESVASLTAASERHDRILDYLLSREAG